MVAGGYYALTVIPGCFALAFIGLSAYRLGILIEQREAQVDSDPLIRRIRQSWTLLTVFLAVYSLLMTAECIDPRGVFGIYSPVTGYALRFMDTELLILATLTLMYVFLMTGHAVRNQEAHWSMAIGFMVAASVKFLVGLISASLFISDPRKINIVVNDWTLFVCFVVSMCMFLFFLKRVIVVVSAHVVEINMRGASNDTKPLSRTLLKLKLVFVLTALCLLGAAPFLVINALKHAAADTVDDVLSDPNHYAFEPSVWFKLLWTCFLFWNVPNPSRKAPQVRRMVSADYAGGSSIHHSRGHSADIRPSTTGSRQTQAGGSKPTTSQASRPSSAEGSNQLSVESGGSFTRAPAKSDSRDL